MGQVCRYSRSAVLQEVAWAVCASGHLNLELRPGHSQKTKALFSLFWMCTNSCSSICAADLDQGVDLSEKWSVLGCYCVELGQ